MTEPRIGAAKGYNTTVFFDEGALDGKARIPSACAVIVDDVDAIHKAIESTIHRLALRRDFRLESASGDFRTRGFHHAEDPPIARHEFLRLIPTLDLEWWCSSNLQPSSDPYDTLANQFQWLAERILRKLRNKNVTFVFEQNSRLNGTFRKIVDISVLRSGYDPLLVSHRIGDKQDRALSIADYCISVSSKAIVVWMDSCCDTSKLPARFQYRNFALIEKACSVLHPWGMNRSLSSRTSGRLLDRSYFQLTGHHRDSCSRSIDHEVSS